MKSTSSVKSTKRRRRSIVSTESNVAEDKNPISGRSSDDEEGILLLVGSFLR